MIIELPTTEIRIIIFTICINGISPIANADFTQAKANTLIATSDKREHIYNHLNNQTQIEATKIKTSTKRAKRKHDSTSSPDYFSDPCRSDRQTPPITSENIGNEITRMEHDIQLLENHITKQYGHSFESWSFQTRILSQWEKSMKDKCLDKLNRLKADRESLMRASVVLSQIEAY